MNRSLLSLCAAALFVLTSLLRAQEQDAAIAPAAAPAPPDTYHVTWEGLTGRHYYLQVSVSMEENAWTYGPVAVTGTGGTLTQPLTVSSTPPDRIFVRVQWFTDADRAPAADYDGDGLTNADEVTLHGTQPFQADTDGDGSPDGEEHALLTDPLDRHSAPTVLLPMRRRQEVPFSWNGSDSGGTYRHGYRYYDEDPAGAWPWQYRHLHGLNADNINGLPLFHLLHVELTGAVPFSNPPPAWFTEQARPGVGAAAAMFECDLRDGGGGTLEHTRVWARGAAPLDADLFIPVLIQRFHAPVHPPEEEPISTRYEWLRIPAGENLSENCADVLSGYNEYYPWAGYDSTAPREYWAAPDPGGWKDVAVLAGSPLKANEIRIHEVSFSGEKYFELHTDRKVTATLESIGYAAPHWRDPNWDGSAETAFNIWGVPKPGFDAERNCPVAFTAGSRPSLAGKLTIHEAAGQRFDVTAVCKTQGLEIAFKWEDVAAENNHLPLAASQAIKAPDNPAAGTFPSQIRFYNAANTQASPSFQLEWRVRRRDASGPVGEALNAGTTNHTLYITLRDPISTAVTLKRETLFNIGCRKAHGLAAAAGNAAAELAIVDAIYAEFTDRIVHRVKPSSGDEDSVPMIYWKENAPTSQTTDALLNLGHGSCAAWSYFFCDVLRSQGIDSQIIDIKPPGSEAFAPFPSGSIGETIRDAVANTWGGSINGEVGVVAPILLVKNWTLTGQPLFPWEEDGLPAQGNDNPTSIFENHRVVEYDGNWYDASYGTSPCSPLDWETDSVEAFGYMWVGPNPLPIQPAIYIPEANPVGQQATPTPVEYNP